MGLLSKASEFTVKPSLAFSNFIISHNIKTFAKFELKNKFYSITNSVGLDGSTLLSSQSTADFWEGICPENDKIYKFTNDNKSLNPMLQFFSFELMEQITFISLYKHNNVIYMICDKDFNKEITDELDKLNFDDDYIDLNIIKNLFNQNQKLLMYNVNFSEAISNYLSKKVKDIKEKESLKPILFNELANNFSCYISKASTKKNDDFSINVILSVNKEIQNEHIISHIVYYMRKILGQTTQFISFNFKGEATSQSNVKDFLQVD